MAEDKVYTTKEAGVLLHNEGFDPDLGDVAPVIQVEHMDIKSISFVYPGKFDVLYSLSEADDIHVTLLDEDEEESDDGY